MAQSRSRKCARLRWSRGGKGRSAAAAFSVPACSFAPISFSELNTFPSIAPSRFPLPRRTEIRCSNRRISPLVLGPQPNPAPGVTCQSNGPHASGIATLRPSSRNAGIPTRARQNEKVNTLNWLNINLKSLVDLFYPFRINVNNRSQRDDWAKRQLDCVPNDGIKGGIGEPLLLARVGYNAHSGAIALAI